MDIDDVLEMHQDRIGKKDDRYTICPSCYSYVDYGMLIGDICLVCNTDTRIQSICKGIWSLATVAYLNKKNEKAYENEVLNNNGKDLCSGK